jgi:hypothetical protein
VIKETLSLKVSVSKVEKQVFFCCKRGCNRTSIVGNRYTMGEIRERKYYHTREMSRVKHTATESGEMFNVCQGHCIYTEGYLIVILNDDNDG